MAHETLKALYEMDVEAFGREKAQRLWEYKTKNRETYNICCPDDPPFDGDFDCRRRLGKPWPWEENAKRIARANKDNQDELEARIKELEAQLAGTSEWPADAPEWATHAVMMFSKDPWRGTGHWLPIPGKSLLERPQPPKRKIDWSQLAPWVKQYWEPTFDSAFERGPRCWKLNESKWIPWNVPGCRNGMEGRECPVPDGVVVEVRSTFGETELFIMPSLDWSDFDGRGKITAFRITGIADGWE